MPHEPTDLAPHATAALVRTAPLDRADRQPALVFLARLAPSSRRTLRRDLDVIAAILSGDRCDAVTLAWAAVRYQHVAAVRAALVERYQPASTNRMLSALRGVLRECWRLGLTPADDYQRAADVENVKAETLPRGRALGAGELRALFDSAVADASVAGARDAALVAILYGAGLRRAEAVALDVRDYDRESGALSVRAGKGNKDRIGHAANGSRAAIEAWLAVRGDTAGALLTPVNKGSRISLRRMTDQSVLLILRRRARAAGIASFSPHDLRRSFVSDLLDAGADIATVARLAGHAQVTTTARYDRRGETTKRRAAELLHVPYTPPPPRRA